MAERKEALLLFSKPPVPGMVKTRLTKGRGGVLTDGQAAEFFKRSLWDVSELGMQALMLLQQKSDAAMEADPGAVRRTYEFYVSTPADCLDAMRATYDEIGPWPLEIHYICDSGKTFDDHFDDAFGQLFAAGCENVVSVGGDIPTLPQSHVTQAFDWLDYFLALGTPGFVQAPCQECGTSLVGFSAKTPIDHQGVYYNTHGVPALDGYMAKIDAADIPSAFLPPVSDIDEETDLAHAVSCLRAIRLAAKHQPGLYVAQRTLQWFDWLGISAITPPNENHDPRQYIDR